jgi:hypothetical protein
LSFRPRNEAFTRGALVRSARTGGEEMHSYEG